MGVLVDKFLVEKVSDCGINLTLSPIFTMPVLGECLSCSPKISSIRLAFICVSSNRVLTALWCLKAHIGHNCTASANDAQWPSLIATTMLLKFLVVFPANYAIGLNSLPRPFTDLNPFSTIFPITARRQSFLPRLGPQISGRFGIPWTRKNNKSASSQFTWNCAPTFVLK